MTVTTSRDRSRSRSQGQSRLHWVPAAAGWILGVIAGAALLSSVSTTIRHLTRVPRQFIDNYLFNFPDTSFAWAFALAIMAGALVARKRIAWLVLVIILVLGIGFDVVALSQRDGSRFEDIGEFLGLTSHITALAVLLAAYNEFWAKVRRGALFKAAAVLVAASCWHGDCWNCSPARCSAITGWVTPSTGSADSPSQPPTSSPAGRPPSSTRCSDCSERWR